MRGWTIEWIMLAAALLALSALCTRLAIAYALLRRLLDLPGRRRSHTAATPRGGGIGIVVCALSIALLVSVQVQGPPRLMAMAVFVSIVMVAVVGWIDDHAGLHARTRFAVHCLAAAVLLATFAEIVGLFAPVPRAGALVLYAVGMVIPALAIVWSINLHNFMDGINGLLACQALFVTAVLAICFAQTAGAAAAGPVALLAAATLGFLPFNFPHARVFMGDVGSGVLGLLIAVIVAWQMLTPSIAFGTGLVLCSAFVTDASCTLVSRVLSGRRWYSAHREHLYQWLVRCGHTHAQVVGAYMGWNVLIVLPTVYFMNRAPKPAGIAATGFVYAVAIVLWLSGKRWCAGRIRRATA